MILSIMSMKCSQVSVLPIRSTTVSAVIAVSESLDHFRDKPCQLGRARIFAEKSVGLDDPGMVAFQRILDSIA